MGSTEDGDLIDLGNDTCVSRVTLSNATIEEQEHLLDVCPPKLEETLFLSKKQEHQLQESENGDVLVILGHDQVVPIRKRIDVVSSDTIKRIRDITKNLEPVISRNPERNEENRDAVDGVSNPEDPGRSNGHEEDSFEAQEISNAFHFLSEHEDNENVEDRFDDSTCESTGESNSTSSRFLVTQDEFNFPFESSRTFDRQSSSHDVDRVVTQDERRLPLDDLTNFESSSRRSFCSRKSSDCVSSPRRSCGSFRRSRRSCESSPRRIRPISLDLEWRGEILRGKHGHEDGSVLEAKRRSLRRHQRKSWTEGTGLGNTPTFILDRCSSLQASTSDSRRCGADFFGRSSPVCASEDGCSESSEVDWSWLEEVECPRASVAGVPVDCATVEGAERRRSCEAGRSTAMTVGATGKSLEQSGHWQSQVRPPTPTSRQTTATNAPLNAHESRESTNNNSSATINSNNTNFNSIESSFSTYIENERTIRDESSASVVPSTTSSWMRASMRRLRHFRLPESQQVNEIHRRAPNSLPDIALIAPEILAAQTNGTSGTLRPSSAPVRNGATDRSAVATVRRVAPRHCAVSRPRGRENGPGNHDDVSGNRSTSNGSTSGSSTANSPRRIATRRVCERQRDVDREDDRGEDDDEDENPLGKWPHAVSSTLACLGCTLGLFNISRFAILSVQFGANFIVQFLILSLVLGIPLFTLQVCLGQRLTAGSVDMWKISPLFQGVGVALLVAHALIGIYSIVGVSWMFVYFRDSFITKQDKYRWAEPLVLYGPTHNTTATYKLQETVPDYFNDAVLRRQHLNESDAGGAITLKFQVAFNLAVVWMIVFVSLSKGLRSYGKVVYVFTLVPVFGTLILCTKLLGLTPPGSLHQLFPATVWTEFFLNSRSWVAASNEVFLTWGLLGAAAMQIAAHNKHKHLLQRDTSFVIVLTFVVLLLAALLANTCVQILRDHGYIYTTSSFERSSTYMFMRPVSQPAPPGYSGTPERFMTHTSFLVGERVSRPGADLSTESGYQILRLSTELVPATLAVLGTEQVSPFWAVLFYFILILFGIAQQLAIWHCVITGIMAINSKMMKLWKTTITFFSCACAYILGLPMATELGVYVVYYLDYTVGGAWWIIVLYLVQVGAVFAVRGRPHSGEAVVAELFPPTGRCLRHWAGPLLSFTWNVILPVILMVLSITLFKNGGFRELYTYRRTSRDYWAIWARQLGASIQLIPVLTIPAVAIIQTCRYLNNGPPDILDRIQMLYRPNLEPDDPRDAHTQIGSDVGTSIHGNGILPTTTDVPFEDPPPKYTPPPSYTTATGARIAKMLRQSFRRSVRRIANVLGESSVPRQRPALQPPPPDYATVLVEMNQSARSHDISIQMTSESRPDVVDRSSNVRINNHEDTVDRAHTIDRMTRINNNVDRRTVERAHSTLDRGRRSNPSSANLTAADVANLLRSSIRRGTTRTQHTLRRSFCHEESRVAASVENLVDAAAPIGQDSLVLPKDVSLVPDERANDDRNDEKKTADEMENSVSVI